MKSLKSFGKLTIIIFSILLTSFAVACFYGDLRFNSTAFMKHSKIKFERRLDENLERFVASKANVKKAILTQSIKCTVDNKYLVQNNIWNVYSVQRINRNNEDIALKDIYKNDQIKLELNCEEGQTETRKIILIKGDLKKTYWISLERVINKGRLAIFNLDWNGTTEILEIERTSVLANQPAVHESDEQETINAQVVKEEAVEEYQVLTANFEAFKQPSNHPSMKNVRINSGSITVVVENKKITEITNLYVEFNNGDSYEISASVSVNPFSGQFSVVSSTGSEYNDGGFINFNGNAFSLNLRFFTGILQDSLIVFADEEAKAEQEEETMLARVPHDEDSSDEIDGESPDDAYNRIIAEDRRAEHEEEVKEARGLVFQSKSPAYLDRVRQAEARAHELAAENDEEIEPIERTEEMEMQPADPERAQGFVFKPNAERI